MPRFYIKQEGALARSSSFRNDYRFGGFAGGVPGAVFAGSVAVGAGGVAGVASDDVFAGAGMAAAPPAYFASAPVNGCASAGTGVIPVSKLRYGIMWP